MALVAAAAEREVTVAPPQATAEQGVTAEAVCSVLRLAAKAEA